MINRNLCERKNGKEKPENFLSRLVERTEQMSNRLIDNLKKISNIFQQELLLGE